METPVAEIHYTGELRVRPYRRGTFLGEEHLEEVIERALGPRYRFGTGWRGQAVVTIRLYEEQKEDSAPA
jgi:hypothetical protein